ncbi:hypothetical protein C4D60_Mb02t20680 [Musa balbisiana]|uniref:Uncharacterized protein n=1 Tax=Musa balbisiana TaxID=52838 RepID=A0A4S8IDH9_MUSBA|nr:hypothetical protein C4D60_Mb02t20680 [Musa balbisiana]
MLNIPFLWAKEVIQGEWRSSRKEARRFGRKRWRVFGLIAAAAAAAAASPDSIGCDRATRGRDRSRMVRMNGGGCGGAESKVPALWRLADEMNPPGTDCRALEAEYVRSFHRHVWSLVRRFDQPQKYKPFVSRCIVQGGTGVGSLREVNIKSGLPATTSFERLEHLDDDERILSIRIVGGDHRLKNYSSIITAHPETIDGRPATLVIESFVVDVPDGNTKEETCYFVEALIKCNLKSLADISERLAVQDYTEPIDC